MTYFKNYSFEYNSQRADLFKSTVVCSRAEDVSLFKEGVGIAIEPASFYGVITNAKNTGAKYTLDITAESWARELRTNSIQSYTEFRNIDVVKLIENYLLPASPASFETEMGVIESVWTFEYPDELDNRPRSISYILRNGTYASHIGTILDCVGLDYTIYSEIRESKLYKVVHAYYRDDFTNRSVLVASENKTIVNLAATVDYGKIATSITCMGAESEQGTNQVWMDAEMGNWTKVPRVIDIRDTTLKKPEFSTNSKYFWYFPASETDPNLNAIASGDYVTIDSERIAIEGTYSLNWQWVASLENKTLTEANLHTKLEPRSAYTASGILVASVLQNAPYFLESVQLPFTFPNGRNISNYWSGSAIHAIYDDVLIEKFKVSSSDYFSFPKNIGPEKGFVWIGSERIYYGTCASDTDGYTFDRTVRGVPTCAVASCQHCGTWPKDGTVSGGRSSKCKLLQQQLDPSVYVGYLYNFCTLAKTAKSKYPLVTDLTQFTWCPLVFDNDSLCPAMKCPHVKSPADFAFICPKGLTQTEIEYSQRYQHHSNTIVFPASYYYEDINPTTRLPVDTYEIYARDSLIHRYGYLPTQITAKGIADTDSLDKLAEGRLRLSAVPVVGTCNLVNYDPWTLPASAFPGGLIQISVATKSRYNRRDDLWYPTYWFDSASEDPGDSELWQKVASAVIDVITGDIIEPAQWVKIKETFPIQKVIKPQRGMPEMTFGAGDIGFQSVIETISEMQDATSQRHRNQEPSKIIASSDSGLAAKVQNLKSGEQFWIRMVR